jgi:proline iminopeptidase
MSAAQRWNAYENATMAVGEAGTSAAVPAGTDVLARVRVQLHYLASHCFLEPAQLMHGLPRIAELPAVVVQGRRDLACPPVTAYTLAQAWPAARLWIAEEAGHSAMHPALRAALVRATEDFKAALRPSP